MILNGNKQCCVGMMMTFLQYMLLFSLSSATDFYKLLGITRKANQKEIKKAYRQKSLEFHPDKNKEEGASEKFSEIARAYEVLSDEQLKQVYDTQGEEGLKRHQQMQNGGGGGGGDPFQDIFSHFGFNPFGGHGGGQREPGEQQTESVEIPLRMEMRQLYKGEVIDVQYVREVLCTHWEDCMKDDRDCQGPGVKMIQQQIAPGFYQQFQQNDPNCVSRGKSWRSNCKSCPKGKTNPEKIDLTIDVTKGMRNGERITFEGVTDEKPGYKAGDLHYVIKEVPHKVFRRDGDHLYMHQEIPLVDALTGFKLELTHLDDSRFSVQVDTVTDCDHVMRVPGKGMPRRGGNGFGDLYITFDVDFPDTLTNEQKTAIRKILTSEVNGEL